MLRHLWQLVYAFFAQGASGAAAQSANQNRQPAEILQLFQKPNAAGVPSLWAEIRNPGRHDLTFAQLTFFLAYTVQPGAGLMRGGNAIIGLKIALPEAAQLIIPARQTSLLCLFTVGDTAIIAPPKTTQDASANETLRRDHLRFQAALAARGNLMDVLSVEPQASWIELRAPTWRPRDPKAGKVLRHKDYKATSMR